MIEDRVARTSMTIRVITGLTAALGVGLAFSATRLQSTEFYIGAAVVFAVLLYGFLRQPVSFQLSNQTLTVKLRLGQIRFHEIQSATPLNAPLGYGIRLMGNGGLFAATGWYRNRQLGRYRAFVTNRRSCVVIKTAAGKQIVISPQAPDAWRLDGLKKQA